MGGRALTDSLNKLLRSRNAILTLALLTGLVWGKGARWTEPVTLPALAVVMTLSTLGLPEASSDPIEISSPQP